MMCSSRAKWMSFLWLLGGNIVKIDYSARSKLTKQVQAVVVPFSFNCQDWLEGINH
jgi:hypothetical protein